VLPVITQAQKIGYETVGLAVDRLRAKGETCLGPEYSPRQFAYSAVFHGGAYVVEQGLYACRRFPAFVAP
jgi:hypothetical protein